MLTEGKRLRILLIGAHPDDCEGKAGGYAALMAARGHTVRIASMTDGGLGHFRHSSSTLCKIRQKEAAAAAALIGAESEIYPIADGELENNLATRKMVVRRIRAYKPDLIITHRANDYHVDHRNCSLLIQDASYMLRVPGFCPDVEALAVMPHIMYFQDAFTNPDFKPDVVLAVDEVMDVKYRMVAAHESQYFEWLPWMDGTLDEVPADAEARLTWLRTPLLDEDERLSATFKSERGERGQLNITNGYREQLRQRYGASSDRINFVEAFAASEYSAPFTAEVLARYFPD